MSLAYDSGILELRDVGFSYDKSARIIKELTLSVGEGEFLGLLGANGSGKSTILKLGAGVLKPSTGSVTLWGKPLRDYRNKDRAKLISYLPQAMDISVPFTLIELVGMGLYPYDIPPAMTADEALDMVGLAEKRDSFLTGLSGGERRRAFIAMTLLQGAGILLLDEPLANLDIKYQMELVRLLRKLREQRNISVVMALHDINIALQFKKVVLIKDGNILGSGMPEEVLTEASIAEAFDVRVNILRNREGASYISYEENFSGLREKKGDVDA